MVLVTQLDQEHMHSVLLSVNHQLGVDSSVGSNLKQTKLLKSCSFFFQIKGRVILTLPIPETHHLIDWRVGVFKTNS